MKEEGRGRVEREEGEGRGRGEEGEGVRETLHIETIVTNCSAYLDQLPPPLPIRAGAGEDFG